MGQQQLLLLVLGIVIVGLAVVAGINAFQENQTKSSQDALVNEAFRIATDINAWYLKPEAFGGGGSSDTELQGITYADLGVDESNVDATTNAYQTPWGTITLDAGTAGSVVLTLQRSNSDAAFGTVTFTTGEGGGIVYADAAATTTTT